MSFSCLHAGEFCHKTYAEASASHCYAGMRSFSDFESEITVVFFLFSVLVSNYKMVKHNEVAISSQQYVFATKSLYF